MSKWFDTPEKKAPKESDIIKTMNERQDRAHFEREQKAKDRKNRELEAKYFLDNQVLQKKEAERIAKEFKVQELAQIRQDVEAI